MRLSKCTIFWNLNGRTCTRAINYLAWKTKTGTVKSTNRIDNILVLTSLGRDLVSQIELELAKN
ncbi:hypothetical protein RhiirB3_451330 [Rhizophagus irregularis]|nr:hypothetical protein RhiirB3_451330 [Rhizophagus irregularis]